MYFATGLRVIASWILAGEDDVDEGCAMSSCVAFQLARWLPTQAV